MELLAYYILSIFSSIVIFLYVKSLLRSSRLPPGPWPLPIVGNLPIIGDKPHRSLARLAKTHGPLMTVQLGQVTTIVVSSPGVAREVLHDQDQAFNGRYAPDAVKYADHHLVAMTFRPVDQHWKNLRRLFATELFSSQKLNDNRALREKKARELRAFVAGRAASRGEVNIGQAVFATTLNLISNTLLSIDMVEIGSDKPQHFKDLIWAIMFETGAANVSDFFPVLAKADLQGRRRQIGAVRNEINAVFERIIEERLRAKAGSAQGGAAATNDFLDSLIGYHLQDGGFKIDQPTMKALIVELLAAGTDTSTSTVEWAMTRLMCNPDVMRKARAEITSTIPAGKPANESDIQHLPYLHAIVKETLRLHPPTPFMVPRRTETDVQIRGYSIPEGTRVLVNAWAIGRDGEFWAAPEAFEPERFLKRDSPDYKGADFEMIPFGAGRRICPALPLAFKLVLLILTTLLQDFDWELPNGMGPMDVDMDDKFGITVAKAIPLVAIPRLDG